VIPFDIITEVEQFINHTNGIAAQPSSKAYAINGLFIHVYQTDPIRHA